MKHYKQKFLNINYAVIGDKKYSIKLIVPPIYIDPEKMAIEYLKKMYGKKFDRIIDIKTEIHKVQ